MSAIVAISCLKTVILRFTAGTSRSDPFLADHNVSCKSRTGSIASNSLGYHPGLIYLWIITKIQEKALRDFRRPEKFLIISPTEKVRDFVSKKKLGNSI